MTKHLQFLSGGGEMGALMRAYNWELSPMGNVDKWPQSLLTTLGILLNSKFPMFLFWGPHHVCFYNDAYRPSLGNEGKHPAMLGMQGNEAWPEIWHIIKPLIDQVLTDGEATWSEDQLIPIFRNGKIEDVYWTFSYSPVKDETGLPAGVFVTCTETTDKVNNLKKLAESSNQLNFAIEATQLGTWDYNTVTNKFIGNTRFKDWFGIQNGDEFDIAVVMNVVVENDRSRVLEAMQKALEYKSGGFCDIEYSIINPVTKQERIVRSKGKVWFAEDKKPYRFNGTLQDITKEAIARRKIEDSEQRFRNLILQAPVLITTFEGTSYKVEAINNRALEIWGKTYDQVINKPLFEVSPELEVGLKTIFSDIYSTGQPFISNEIPVQLNRHEKIATAYFNSVYQPMRNLENKICGIILIGTEVTEAVNARKQIEASATLLKKEHQLLQNYLMEAPAFFVILKGKENVFEFANAKFQQLIGNRDILGKKIMEALPELKGQKFEVLLDEINHTGKPFSEREMPALIEQEKGKLKQVYIDLNCQSIKNNEGYTDGILILGYDVTELVVGRKLIETSERFNRNILESSPDWLNVLDSEGRIQYINYNGLFQMEIDDFSIFKNQYWWIQWGSENEALVKASIVKAMKGENAHFTAVCPTAKGTLKWWDVVVSPVVKPGEPVQQIIAVSRDITEQKKWEQATERMATHLKLSTDSAGVGTWSLNVKTQELEWSALHKKMWGYDEQSKGLAYEDWHKIILPADKELAFKRVDDASVNHCFYEVEYRINKADDNAIHSIRSIGKYYYNDKGEAETLTGISIDITEQKAAEEKMHQARQLFETTLHNVPLAVYHLDNKGKILFLNEIAAQQMGYDSEKEVLAEKDVYQFRKKLEERFNLFNETGQPLGMDESCSSITLKTGKPAEAVVQFVDKISGSSFWLLTKSVPLINTNGELTNVFTACTDITNLKESELKLKASEERFRTLTETIPQLIWITNDKGEYEYASGQWMEYAGLNPNEEETWQQLVHPDDMKVMMDTWEKCLVTGNPYQVEARLKNKQGEYLWHVVHGIAIKNKQEKILKWIGAFTNIHDQKINEEKKDEFISIASHEMKTPLTTAKGYLELLLPLLNDENQTAFLYANKANQSIERIHQLVTELLDASKIQNGKMNYNFSSFDFNKILDEAIEDIQLTAKNHIIQKTGNCLKQITGDRSRLLQVLINLLSNAVKYSLDADRVIVKIEEQDNKIQVSVQDFGIGISSQHLDKIFDRYYRVQEHAISFQGLGIGLYISYNIVQRHNGTMWAQSELGKGSTFYFTLPM